MLCNLKFEVLVMKSEKQNQVICIGELLIDFFCTDIDVDLQEGTQFLKSAGGAPANVTAAIAKLGGQAAFSGKVGHDPFGYFLKKTLDEASVDTSMLVMDEQASTTLAFVSLKKDGERDFVFNRGADALLTMDEIDTAKVAQAKILHFGSATALLSQPFRQTYLQLMREAYEKEQFISFDPNYRRDLWKGNVDEFVQLSKEAIGFSDLVKVSDEELEIITGIKQDQDKAVALLHELGAKAVAVTLGKHGTLISNGKRRDIVKSIPIQSIDSTGAGDAFVGATLFQLASTQSPREVIDDFDHFQEVISFSNKVGAIVCTKIGAIDALPKLEEVNEY